MPAPDPASLGQFPILQLAFAVVVLVGLALAAYKGFRDKGTGQNVGDENEQRLFFDGPLKRHLEMESEMVEMTRAQLNVADRLEREKVGEELRKQTGLLERMVGALERRSR